MYLCEKLLCEKWSITPIAVNKWWFYNEVLAVWFSKSRSIWLLERKYNSISIYHLKKGEKKLSYCRIIPTNIGLFDSELPGFSLLLSFPVFLGTVKGILHFYPTSSSSRLYEQVHCLNSRKLYHSCLSLFYHSFIL